MWNFEMLKTWWYVKLLAGFKKANINQHYIRIKNQNNRGSLSLRYSHTSEYSKKHNFNQFYVFENSIYFNNQAVYYGYKNDRNIYWQHVLYTPVVITRR
jgi:archaellin